MTARPVGIPNPTPGNTQQTLQRLVEVVNQLQGLQSVELRALRVGDLLDAGVLVRTSTGGLEIADIGGSTPSDAIPLDESDGAAGTATAYARGDHEHPWSGTRANLIHPIEKRSLKIDYMKLVNDHSGLLALADTFGVTTEKAAYEASYNALVAYLAGLIAPSAWDDKAGPTQLT